MSTSVAVFTAANFPTSLKLPKFNTADRCAFSHDGALLYVASSSWLRIFRAGESKASLEAELETIIEKRGDPIAPTAIVSRRRRAWSA